jgi:rhodanese-related sulfurtransferase
MMFKAIRIQVSLACLALLLTSLITSGCTLVTGEEPDTVSTTLQVYDVTVQKAFSLIQENEGNSDFVILDVRTPEEYSEGHIEGAINYDYYAGDFESNLDELDKAKTYLVYCHSGKRSAGARDIMADLGFRYIYNMTGGVSDWQSAGYPVVR